MTNITKIPLADNPETILQLVALNLTTTVQHQAWAEDLKRYYLNKTVEECMPSPTKSVNVMVSDIGSTPKTPAGNYYTERDVQVLVNQLLIAAHILASHPNLVKPLSLNAVNTTDVFKKIRELTQSYFSSTSLSQKQTSALVLKIEIAAKKRLEQLKRSKNDTTH